MQSLSPSQVVLKIISVTFLLLGFAALASIPVTLLLDNDRKAKAALHDAADFVDDFMTNTSRLPRDAELDLWKAEKGGLAAQVNFSLESDLPSGVRQGFGAAPPNGYVLSIWRGDFFDYYASWADATTIASPWRVPLVSAIVGLVLLVGARVLWKL